MSEVEKVKSEILRAGIVKDLDGAATLYRWMERTGLGTVLRQLPGTGVTADEALYTLGQIYALSTELVSFLNNVEYLISIAEQHKRDINEL